MIKHTGNKYLFKTEITPLQTLNSENNIIEGDLGIVSMKSYPRRVIVELTNQCNLNCIMCGRTGRKYTKTEFDLEWFKKIEPFFPHSEEIVLHGWGEPLMHKKFDEILKYLNKFTLRKYFCTNGMLIRKNIDVLFDNHVDIIAFSLDGATCETNKKIRVGSNFDEIVSAVKAIVERKEKNSLSFPYMNFVFTAMKDNIHEVPDMIDLAASVGIPEVKIVYLTAFDDVLAAQSLYNKDAIVRKYFSIAEKRAEEKNILLKLPYLQNEDPAGDNEHKQCFFPFRDLFIGSDGFVRPCVSNSKRLFSIESVDSMEEIWNNSEMKELRKNLTEECSMCYHSSCANWNLKTSFIQMPENLLPEWEK